jgi:Domain of unknown function (DUF4288)
MNWYLVKLIFLVKRGEHAHAPRFDEQWRWIRADEVAWAYEKSAVLGRLEETNFLNDRAEEVECKFIEVGDIHKISSMEDGDELFSVTLDPINADAYIEEVKLKSQRSFDLAKSREVTSMGQFIIKP